MKKRGNGKIYAQNHKEFRYKFLIILLIFIILIIISFFFDADISRFVAKFRNLYLDYFLMGITLIVNNLVILCLFSLFLFYIKPKRRWIVPLWISIGLSYLINIIIKVVIHRPRPFQDGITPLIGASLYLIRDAMYLWDFSFPSGHAVLVFAVLPILNKEFKIFRWIWLAFAVLVCFSRLYFGMHYLSDVLAGAVIGYSIGLLMIKIEEKYRFGKKIIEKLKLD
ncbi:MAG: phosphatase PAP2 family protein [Candidatus Nanoarchaeia archaeon]|nr:phosphatase PAP2 family protein [Candidatus Nanoarchaeia archaeon]